MISRRTTAVCAAAVVAAVGAVGVASTVGAGEPRFRADDVERALLAPPDVAMDDNGGWGTESFPAGVAKPADFTPGRTIFGLGLRRR